MAFTSSFGKANKCNVGVWEIGVFAPAVYIALLVY
jgi:hypothetical protein